MANPLFVADRPTLLKHLRLEGINLTGNANEIIDDTIVRVRTLLRQRLGATGLASVLAQTYTETPATDLEYRRAAATLAEILWIRLELSSLLPTLFLDASGLRDRVWNEEAAFREQPNDGIARLQEIWRARLEEMLLIIIVGPDAQQLQGLKCFLPGPRYTSETEYLKPRPFYSFLRW